MITVKNKAQSIFRKQFAMPVNFFWTIVDSTFLVPALNFKLREDLTNLTVGLNTDVVSISWRGIESDVHHTL